ncbi:MAG: lycopene cyclase domain-containing protein [Bacteroidia bacterium]
MPDKYLYLFINLGSIIVPFLFSFHPKLRFTEKWKSFFISNLIVASFFIIWDIYFTKMGIWGFNERYITGIKIFNLPIEEILFFICIPYASLFTYHCFSVLYPKRFQQPTARTTIILAVFLILVIIFSDFKWYTTFTFSLLFLTLGIIIIFQKTAALNLFYFTYLIILIPFFIVNGILTGTGIEDEVVWYNNSENLGIRILTIPVEDIFYGMLLLLWNTILFDYFKIKQSESISVSI